MRFTKDNVEELYEHCKAAKRHGEQREYNKTIEYVEKALTTLGFTKTQVIEPTSPQSREALIRDFVLYWHKNSKPYHKWIVYQDQSRDWYVNAEIKEAREKMKVSLRPLTLLLLEIAMSVGKVYDK